MDTAEREELNLCPIQGPGGEREEDHFIICPECHQAIDCRRLGDVLWHDEPGHAPLVVH